MNHYAPEHHPNCPRFESFERGDTEDTAPPCYCEQCKKCKGEGVGIATRLFDLGLPGLVESGDGEDICNACDGLGRIMSIEYSIETV